MSHQIHHATRDHRFAYISTGELSWARATSPAIRPEVKTPRTKSTPVDVDALRSAPIITTASNVAPMTDPDLCMVGTFAGEQHRTERDIARTFEICDFMNKLLMPHLCD